MLYYDVFLYSEVNNVMLCINSCYKQGDLGEYVLLESKVDQQNLKHDMLDWRKELHWGLVYIYIILLILFFILNHERIFNAISYLFI